MVLPSLSSVPFQLRLFGKHNIPEAPAERLSLFMLQPTHQPGGSKKEWACVVKFSSCSFMNQKGEMAV